MWLRAVSSCCCSTQIPSFRPISNAFLPGGEDCEGGGPGSQLRPLKLLKKKAAQEAAQQEAQQQGQGGLISTHLPDLHGCEEDEEEGGGLQPAVLVLGADAVPGSGACQLEAWASAGMCHRSSESGCRAGGVMPGAASSLPCTLLLHCTIAPQQAEAALMRVTAKQRWATCAPATMARLLSPCLPYRAIFVHSRYNAPLTDHIIRPACLQEPAGCWSRAAPPWAAPWPGPCTARAPQPRPASLAPQWPEESHPFPLAKGSQGWTSCTAGGARTASPGGAAGCSCRARRGFGRVLTRVSRTAAAAVLTFTVTCLLQLWSKAARHSQLVVRIWREHASCAGLSASADRLQGGSCPPSRPKVHRLSRACHRDAARPDIALYVRLNCRCPRQGSGRAAVIRPQPQGRQHQALQGHASGAHRQRARARLAPQRGQPPAQHHESHAAAAQQLRGSAGAAQARGGVQPDTGGACRHAAWQHRLRPDTASRGQMLSCFQVSKVILCVMGSWQHRRLQPCCLAPLGCSASCTC